MSVNILDDILADNLHDMREADLNDEEIKHINAMITSEKGGSSPPPGKRWLYEVCSPAHNSNSNINSYLSRKTFNSPVVLCSACKWRKSHAAPYDGKGRAVSMW